MTNGCKKGDQDGQHVDHMCRNGAEKVIGLAKVPTTGAKNVQIAIIFFTISRVLTFHPPKSRLAVIGGPGDYYRVCPFLYFQSNGPIKSAMFLCLGTNSPVLRPRPNLVADGNHLWSQVSPCYPGLTIRYHGAKQDKCIVNKRG